MTDLLDFLIGLAILAIITLLDRFLPKWFGALPIIAYLIFMIYLAIFKDVGNSWSFALLIIGGSAILASIWLKTLEHRKAKVAAELDKMKAKDSTFQK